MKNLTVLIGDNDEIHTDLCGELIRETCGGDHSIRVLTTMNGEELFELARTNRADLLVLFLNNVQFPGLQFDLQARLSLLWPVIRRLKEELGKPVIGISGIADFEQSAMDAGVDCFFLVPYRIGEFQSAVKKCLSI